jgi:hypothetical protein
MNVLALNQTSCGGEQDSRLHLTTALSKIINFPKLSLFNSIPDVRHTEDRYLAEF